MHDAWIERVSQVASKALCLKARCGSIIVKDGEVIGEGYNAPPRDNLSVRRCDKEDHLLPKKNYDKTCCVHAEWRAVMDALRTNPEKIRGSVLYFTRVDENGAPVKSGRPFCTVCSRLVLDVGVAFFVLWHEEGVVAYPTDEYNNLSYTYKV